MADPEQPDLVQYRIESAEERLEAARVLLKRKLYKDAISRAYYAIFQAARAVLATKKLDARKHSGIISRIHSATKYLPPLECYHWNAINC